MNRRTTKTTWMGAALAIVLTVCAGVLSGRSTMPEVHHNSQLDARDNPGAAPPHVGEHRVPRIEGATNPSAIDDDVARVLFLRMAAHPDPIASEAYLRYMFNNVTGVTSGQTKQLTGIVDRYAQRLKSLDLAGTDPLSRKAELHDMVAEFRQQFAAALGPYGISRFDRVIDERVKSRVRVFARP